MIVAREAWKDSGLDKESENMERVGIIIGSGIGGIQTIETEHEKCMTKGPDRVSPMYIPMGILNMATGNNRYTYSWSKRRIYCYGYSMCYRYT